MNLALSNDILDDYPEQVTHTLRSGHATCLKFNRKGDYLATGRSNGGVVVWDLDTMGMARKLRGHCYAVSSLSWSESGRYLLSSCQGWLAILWDLQDGSQHRQVRFNAPVFMAELNPLNHLQLVACLYEDQPHLVDITDEVPIKHVLPSVPARDSEDMTAQAAEKMAKEDARNMTTAVTFTSNGKYILAGTSKGNINLIDTETREIIYSTNICSAIIIGVQTSQSSRVMLVNSKDRIIRTFRLPDFSELDAGSIAIELEHRFQDVVNRMSWNHTTFSATGDYVIASTFNSHELYLWERGMGSLVRMLVGRTEEMGMIDWHPYRPMFAVLNLDMGVIYIWSVTIDQKWSALAPDFVEVEENVEYHEREDEFDTYPKEDITKQRLEAEDEMIDIRPVERDAADEGFVMPVYYDIGDTDSEQELVHVKPGTMRRKGSGEEDVEDAGDDKLATAAAAGPSKKKNKNRRR